MILSTSQIRICEKHTMDDLPISSIDLMEEAGTTCANEISDILFQRNIDNVFVFCGTGNNGGDGLVIARKLIKDYFGDLSSVTVVICQREDSHPTPEFQKNLSRWKNLKSNKTKLLFFEENNPVHIPETALIVDALFGIGLNKPATGIHASAIRTINASDAYTVAIDIPSGLFADQPTPPNAEIVIANATLSIQFQKLVFMLPQASAYYGEIQNVDIGMYPPADLDIHQEYLCQENIRPLLLTRDSYAHKGTFGHGLLVAGSDAMPGAAILAAHAAMRGGIGKLTVHTTDRAATALPIQLPEAILNLDKDSHVFSDLEWSTLQSNINAIAIGPGLGTHAKTVNALKDVLDTIHTPLILDADALNMLADNKTWLAFLPPHSILTPHFHEFDKLAGKAENDFDRIEKARAFAQRYEIILVLKGHHTVISMPDGRQFFNSTGNSGMATAGSGDTLTGLLLALLAQGYSPESTALLGVYIHGLAGDLYAEEFGETSLIASDLPKWFGKAFCHLQRNESDTLFNF